MIVIYTDGACSKGNGGWAWWVSESLHASGCQPGTTNQQMELKATIEALAYFPFDDVTIVSDSAYVTNCFFERWYVGWRKKGWVNSKKKPVENRDLWEQLLALIETHVGSIDWIHVRGHGKRATDDPIHVKGNDHADRLAVAARKELVA